MSEGHLHSLGRLEAETLRRLIRGEGAEPDGSRRLVVLLDFLPLGAGALVLRAAAARLGAEVVPGAALFPGFPARTDLLEAVRAAGAYADAVVLRHPLRGASRAAAAVSAVPVISAGDGSGEDPLFGVAELAVLSDRIGDLTGKSVALCGDLVKNRRAHSLAVGLAGAGARPLLVPAKGCEPDQGFMDWLAECRGYHPVRFGAQSMDSLLDMVDSWLLTPDLDHQLSLFTDLTATSDDERRMVRHQVKEVAALWVAAARTDEGEPEEPDPRAPLPWRAEDGRTLTSPAGPGEEETDWERRAPAETAAVAAVLARAFRGEGEGAAPPDDAYAAREGIGCRDARCVACREPVRVEPAFRVGRTDPVVLTCVYCWSRTKARFVGSRVEKRYHPLSSSQVRKILKRNTVFFGSAEQAEEAGFVSSKI